ncbi:MAG: hypothetical protein AAF986_03555 [Pseudomonadota bacterium]
MLSCARAISHTIRYPHIINPDDIGITDKAIRAEVIKLETDIGRRFGILILRQYLLPENDGTTPVLTQHLSARISAQMGSTAMLAPALPKLATIERQIAHSALAKMFKLWRSERGSSHG